MTVPGFTLQSLGSQAPDLPVEVAWFLRRCMCMTHEDAVVALACLLEPPRPRERAAALLRDLASVHAAAQGDEAWWRARGAVTHREAQRLCAAFRLHALVQAMQLPSSMTGPEEVARALAPIASRGREELWLLTVDSSLRPLSRVRVAQGGRTSCSATPADVLRRAILDGATGLFLAHNHPSGDPRPSASDRRFTTQLSRAARPLGITVHDHLVLTTRAWRSELTEAQGLMSPRRAQVQGDRVSDSP